MGVLWLFSNETSICFYVDGNNQGREAEIKNAQRIINQKSEVQKRVFYPREYVAFDK